MILSIIRYQISKYIGAYLSVMNGIDAIVFTSDYLSESLPLIKEICNNLKFLGLKLRDPSRIDGNVLSLSASDSKVKCFCMKYNKWMAISEMMTNFLRGDKNE